MTKDKLIISAYGSHNGGIAMYYKGQYYVVEAERWLNSKNIGISNYMPCRNPQLVFDQITEWLLSKTDRSDVDIFMTGYLPHIKPKFSYGQNVGCDHHTAHASTAFYQSPHKEALIFTFDGGGDAGYFNVYTATRSGGIKLIDKFNQDLGFPYMILSDYLSDIKKESLSIGNLVYAGKLMGLCSYGVVHEDWLPYFDEFYDKFNYFGNSYIGGAEARYEAITLLMTQIGVENFDFENTRLEGQLSWDIAATTQRAFENQFFKNAKQYMDKYPELPICMAGGCALNVLLNTKLIELGRKVFVPPNVSDCGIAVGSILWYLAPEVQVDLTYSGLPLMDLDQLGVYLEDRQFTMIENIGLEDLATYLAQGHIVGFLQGNAEHGSRALGNRSILCNPVGDMKDVLNNKVKHREWYRPFAPIVRLEDVHKYFDFAGEESRHMTFVANVKEEWRSKLPAITHEDGTGRLQTVTKWQNEAIYNLITEFEKVAGHAVILNTSFNDNGKPILSTFADAFKLLRETQLDAVYYHEKRLIVFKNGGEKRFKKSLEAEGIAPVTLDTTVNILAFAKDQDELINEYIPKIQKLAKKHRRIVVAVETKYNKLLVDAFSASPHVKIYTVGTNKHYQQALINDKTKGLLDEYDKSSTYFFSQFIKPFWCKEIITENLHNTKYHLFIDLFYDKYVYNYDIIRDVKVLSEMAKIEDDVVGIAGLKQNTSIFDEEFLAKRFNGFVPEFYPLPYIFYGNLEGIEWYANNYEGMILWYMNQNKVGKIEDYLLVSYAENKHRYNFLELEIANGE